MDSIAVAPFLATPNNSIEEALAMLASRVKRRIESRCSNGFPSLPETIDPKPCDIMKLPRGSGPHPTVSAKNACSRS
jgi:hypothetical protein